MNEKKAIQDYYSDEMSHCYGCGRLNTHGYQLKSYWDGSTSYLTFKPEPYHTAVPRFVYGGLLASLIDCHGTGTAAAALHQEEGREMGTEPKMRFVTASLHVDYLKPTPIDATLELKGKVKEIKGRKVIVQVELSARGEICAQGEIVAVKIPQDMVLK
jgi:acyl-coenzyme A thioesterase PaaI-like protein